MAIIEPSLGDYLRHLRRASPAARAGRLSRERVAASAKISMSYLIRMEQGSAENPSPECLRRLAETFELNQIQVQHLNDLARQGQMIPIGDRAVPPVITDVMREHIDYLLPHLCGYVNERWDVLYANSEYCRIYRNVMDVGNVLKWFFCIPESREVMVEWEAEARLTVAWLRTLIVRSPDSSGFGEFLNDLAANAEFREMWNAREILMSRHSPYMKVRDLDSGQEVSLLAQVYAWPDPTQRMQMFLGIRTDR
jgi:transcriptional regulator with XRE-family HTH domain